MAQTQSIKCIKCGKILGMLDCSSGDFHAVHFIPVDVQEEKKGKSLDVDPKQRGDFNRAVEVKNKYRKQKDPQGNIGKGATNITCSCGQVNKII